MCAVTSELSTSKIPNLGYRHGTHAKGWRTAHYFLAASSTQTIDMEILSQHATSTTVKITLIQEANFVS